MVVAEEKEEEEDDEAAREAPDKGAYFNAWSLRAAQHGRRHVRASRILYFGMTRAEKAHARDGGWCRLARSHSTSAALHNEWQSVGRTARATLRAPMSRSSRRLVHGILLLRRGGGSRIHLLPPPGARRRAWPLALAPRLAAQAIGSHVEGREMDRRDVDQIPLRTPPPPPPPPESGSEGRTRAGRRRGPLDMTASGVLAMLLPWPSCLAPCPARLLTLECCGRRHGLARLHARLLSSFCVARLRRRCRRIHNARAVDLGSVMASVVAAFVAPWKGAAGGPLLPPVSAASALLPP